MPSSNLYNGRPIPGLKKLKKKLKKKPPDCLLCFFYLSFVLKLHLACLTTEQSTVKAYFGSTKLRSKGKAFMKQNKQGTGISFC